MDNLIDDIYNVINPRILEYVDKKLELELRFGFSTDQNFNTDITKYNWNIIKDQLETSTNYNVFLKKIDECSDTYYKDYRITTKVGSDGLVVSKIKKDKLVNLNIITNSVFDIRLSLSHEESINDDEEQIVEPLFRRLKSRTTYIYKNWNYDLSVIILEIDGIKKEIYEFELELNSDDVLYSKDELKKFIKSSIIKTIDIFKFFEKDQNNFTFKIK